MAVVNCIDAAVRKCGCTQAELARRLGVSAGLISMWKRRGYVTQKYLRRAAKVTGLPPHVLNPYVPEKARE